MWSSRKPFGLKGRSGGEIGVCDLTNKKRLNS